MCTNGDASESGGTGAPRLSLQGLPDWLRDPEGRAAWVQSLRAAVPEGMAVDGCLLWRSGGGLVRTAAVSASFLIGRARECDLCLDDETVSRHHCRLEPAEGGALRVLDLASTNGTLVDGAPVREGPVPPGAVLAVGRILLAWMGRG